MSARSSAEDTRVMNRSRRIAAILVLVSTCLAAAPAALAIGSSRVAALQVALRARHVYDGTVDGEPGPATTGALTKLQRRGGLVPDGVAGPKTRRLLGRLAGPGLGSRPLVAGMVGGDVAELQFLLAWHGFPSGVIDGALGSHTQAALLRFQRWAGLPAVGVAGPATIAALSSPLPTCPLRLAWPLRVSVGDPFGPRGAGFHPGIDLPAAVGTPVGAAAVDASDRGTDSRRLWQPRRGRAQGADGVETFYAHLSRVLVSPGEAVTAGSLVGPRRLDRRDDRAAPPLRGARARSGGRPAAGARLRLLAGGDAGTGDRRGRACFSRPSVITRIRYSRKCSGSTTRALASFAITSFDGTGRVPWTMWFR